MKVADQYITRVYAVESLREGDSSTGRSILEEIYSHNQTVGTDFKKVNNKKQLFIHLKDIAMKSKKNDGVLLFIEAHGCMDGIDIGSDKVPWSELTKDLKSINEACLMGLVVVFSCCYGIYYFRQTSLIGRSPYYVMFGVDNSIYEDKLLETNKRLVRGFAASSSLNNIISECNLFLNVHDINLTCLEAGDMFINAFVNYLSEECKPEKLEVRASDCYQLLKESCKQPYIGYEQFKNTYINSILNIDYIEEKYNEMRDLFLMTDLDESLDQRFRVNFNAMYEQANMAETLDRILETYST